MPWLLRILDGEKTCEVRSASLRPGGTWLGSGGRLYAWLERPRGNSGGLPDPPGRALRHCRHFTLPSHLSDASLAGAAPGPADSVCVTAGPGDVGTVPSARVARGGVLASCIHIRLQTFWPDENSWIRLPITSVRVQV